MRKPRFHLGKATEGVGRIYPQHQEMLGSYDYDGARSIHRLSMYEFANFEPDFNKVVLDKRAKPTDLISSVPIPNVGLLVSDRFLTLLRSFKLPPHRVCPIPMVHKHKEIEGYSWLHLPQPPSLMAAATTQDVEEGADADPLLYGVALLKLYRPSWLAYCWVNPELKTAIQSQGITGVKLS